MKLLRLFGIVIVACVAVFAAFVPDTLPWFDSAPQWFRVTLLVVACIYIGLWLCADFAVVRGWFGGKGRGHE